MRNRDGFTLLELVAALSLSAVIGIWVAGFFGSQMHEYKKQTQILKTEELADRVCFQITSRLDHAFLFRVDPKESSVLYYCEGSGELGEQWEQISEEDLGLGAEKEYEVRLDFSDTQSQKAVSEITVLYKGEKVYSRTIRLSSVYGYLEDGEDEKGENENKDGSLSWLWPGRRKSAVCDLFYYTAFCICLWFYGSVQISYKNGSEKPGIHGSAPDHPYDP